MNKKVFIKKVLVASVLLAGGGFAQAASIALNPATVSTSTATVPPITTQFTGDGVVSLIDLEIKFDQARLSGAAVGANGATCAANNTTGVVIISFAEPAAQPLPNGPTNYCTMNFTVIGALPVAGDPVEILPLTIQNDLWGDGAGNPVVGSTVANGEIRLTTGPAPDIVVSLTPAAGSTITFPGGTPGSTSTSSIAVAVASGTVGSGTVGSCALSGADAAAFAITGTLPVTVPPAGSIGLSATLGAAPITATLTCQVTDAAAGSPNTVTWTLNAPAGTTLAGPTLGASPASGSAITLPVSTGTPVSSSITITPTGGDTGGPAASLSCSAAAGFTVTPGPLSFAVGSTAQTVAVGCSPGAAPVTGTITCTGTDNSGAISWNWDATCPAAGTAPPAPTFIPASSLWSKFALIGIFAALGLLVVGLRRNH